MEQILMLSAYVPEIIAAAALFACGIPTGKLGLIGSIINVLALNFGRASNDEVVSGKKTNQVFHKG